MSEDRAARAGAALERLDEIARRLRRECPWDREQDERSIVPHTVEEAYELADAAHSGDDAKLLDELGDVLFQVHFLSLLLEERGAGTLAQVADGCREKLVRRHPHVFGEVEARTTGEVRRNWDEIKRTSEGRGARGLFADVPENLPSLLYARKVLRRAERVGRGPNLEQALERLETDVDRLAPDEDDTHEEREVTIGETLFALVEVAAAAGVDPELALRAASKRVQAKIGEDAGSHE
ncbi:nucleoside triphosphate pyrophosphohydrolase [soil metagenome]|jgi:MazG family protein|nr:MazG family protein [Actinomycetota bacterium]MDQ3319949.1 MazG family protein [Actinomycetota bacterium]MDQ3357035.1 MazG family protein [Actinomycetota bacterium]